MCVVSNVMDEWTPQIPEVIPGWPQGGVTTITPSAWLSAPSLEDIRKLIQEFMTKLEAAKEADRKSGAADCVDPEKAKLLDRVVELEKLLANPPEFVIVKGGNIEPGKYRVVDGKLYKQVE